MICTDQYSIPINISLPDSTQNYFVYHPTYIQTTNQPNKHVFVDTNMQELSREMTERKVTNLINYIDE